MSDVHLPALLGQVAVERLVQENPNNLIGLEVVLTGLAARPELNGHVGIVVCFDPNTARMGVAGVAVDTLAIKPANISLTPESLALIVPKGTVANNEELKELISKAIKGMSLEELGVAGLPDEGLARLLVPAAMLRHKQEGSKESTMLAWRVCEKVLPIFERVCGRLSPEVASVCQHQINIYEDLSPGLRLQQRYPQRCIERAQALQRLARSAPWLENATVELIWTESDGQVGAAFLEAEALLHMGSAYQDLKDPSTSRISYEQAIRLIKSAGLGETDICARAHNQQIACT